MHVKSPDWGQSPDLLKITTDDGFDNYHKQ